MNKQITDNTNSDLAIFHSIELMITEIGLSIARLVEFHNVKTSTRALIFDDAMSMLLVTFEAHIMMASFLFVHLKSAAKKAIKSRPIKEREKQEHHSHGKTRKATHNRKILGHNLDRVGIILLSQIGIHQVDDQLGSVWTVNKRPIRMLPSSEAGLSKWHTQMKTRRLLSSRPERIFSGHFMIDKEYESKIES